jgi:hypothetical protein
MVNALEGTGLGVPPGGRTHTTDHHLSQCKQARLSQGEIKAKMCQWLDLEQAI